RHGAVRRVHRPHRRPADAKLRDARLGGGRKEHHDDRSDRRNPGRQGGAGRLGRGERAAVRLLPVGPGDERCGAPRFEEEPGRRRHRQRDVRKHLPLRHLPAHPRRHQGRGSAARMIANVSRRVFFKASGALVLAISFPGKVFSQTQNAFSPNAFVRIGSDNSVTVIVKHLEMGQGTFTGLPTLVAEELDADWRQIRAEGAPADASRYNNLFFGQFQGTGGSTAIANSFEQMRKAGAAARAMLVAAAAERWGVAPDTVTVQRGMVLHTQGKRKATFGQLAAEAAKQPVPADVKLKDPKDFIYIGQRAPRTDSRAKST